MLSTFEYSEFEKQKNHDLDKLMNEWIEQLSKNKTPIDNGNKETTIPQDCFAKDGFFPGYFDQKRKTVFIGRETRNIGGYDFRDTTKEFFDKDFSNKNSWWRHIFYIVYGIKTEGKFPFENIPTALEILNKMRETKDFGFACINISKYSNDDPDNWETNTDLVDRFLKDSELEKTNFFQEQLKILDPDIIITANLWDGTIAENYINLCFPGEFSKNKTLTHNKEGVAADGKYNLNGKEIDYIDLFHFSANKSDEYCYYNPVMKILFNKARK
ncbi:hypothetical protein [Treponema socranskii]|uniref:hypothetical protein n=1 Tax=Treponema socranskii TaxID=53419 RepID=UPI0028EFF047|nr:hypothetical protein [Treponema socranskii]